MKLALTLPGFGQPQSISPQDVPGLKAEFVNLGALLSRVFDVVLLAASFLTFFYLIIGALRYLSAGDSKDNLNKARQRMVWAIIGFIVVVASFTVKNYVQAAFKFNPDEVEIREIK